MNECGHRQFASQEALFDYIQKMHDKYLSSKIDTAKDIENIVLVNKQVVDGIDYLFLKNRMQRQSCIAQRKGSRKSGCFSAFTGTYRIDKFLTKCYDYPI